MLALLDWLKKKKDKKKAAHEIALWWERESNILIYL